MKVASISVDEMESLKLFLSMVLDRLEPNLHEVIGLFPEMQKINAAAPAEHQDTSVAFQDSEYRYKDSLVNSFLLWKTYHDFTGFPF
jgi:Na+-transporting NADH:ubiquinone oxidoreductase subunit NqrE